MRRYRVLRDRPVRALTAGSRRIVMTMVVALRCSWERLLDLGNKTGGTFWFLPFPANTTSYLGTLGIWAIH